MLNCRQAAELLSQSHDRRLTHRERVRLRIHEFACRKCSRYAAQLRFIQIACGEVESTSAVAEIKLSETARERVKRALKGL